MALNKRERLHLNTWHGLACATSADIHIQPLRERMSTFIFTPSSLKPVRPRVRQVALLDYVRGKTLSLLSQLLPQASSRLLPLAADAMQSIISYDPMNELANHELLVVQRLLTEVTERESRNKTNLKVKGLLTLLTEYQRLTGRIADQQKLLSGQKQQQAQRQQLALEQVPSPLSPVSPMCYIYIYLYIYMNFKLVPPTDTMFPVNSHYTHVFSFLLGCGWYL